MMTKRRLGVVAASLVVAAIAVIAALPAPTPAEATGLQLTHLLILNGGVTLTLEAGYVPQPTLTGDSFWSDEVESNFFGADIQLSYDVSLLTPDSHLAISNLTFTLVTGCEYTIQQVILLNLSVALGFHASVNINPLTSISYVGCSGPEIAFLLSMYHSGPTLFHFSLEHGGPSPLTLQHAETTFGYDLTFSLGVGYTPQEVETSDHFSSDDFEPVNPNIPDATIDFDVTLLTADSHLQLSNLVVELDSGCTYTFHPAFLLNLVAALTYRVDAAVNAVTQILYAGCTSQEIQLVQLYFFFGNELEMELTLAH